MSELDDLIRTRVLVVRPDDAHATLMTIDRRLESFQAIVGGWIEGLTLNDKISCYIDEEGKLKGLRLNVLGDLAVRMLLEEDGYSLLKDDFIVGPVVFVGRPDDEGWDTDVPQDFVDRLRRAEVEIREES